MKHLFSSTKATLGDAELNQIKKSDFLLMVICVGSFVGFGYCTIVVCARLLTDRIQPTSFLTGWEIAWPIFATAMIITANILNQKNL